MKKFMLALLCSGIIFSCNKNDLPPQDYVFNFHPRDCNYAWIDLAQLVTISGGRNVATSLRDKSIKTENFLFAITTFDIMNSYLLAKRNDSEYDPANFPIYSTPNDSINNNNHHNPETQLETQLANSYSKTYQSKTVVGGIVTPTTVDINYRLTEVKNLTISSNITLFGQAAGSSLNNFLEIYSISPSCIISAQKQLVLGFNQSANQMSIQEWLNMHPMAAPSMLLHFKTTPAEAPVNAQFILKMDMAGGAVLKDTSSVITLLP